MSGKPKYYYDLTIYDPVKSDAQKVVSEPPPKPWNIRLGIGDWILSAIAASRNTAQELNTKGTNLLDYAASQEGRVKISVIAASTCFGGVISLVTRPRGTFRKLLYPATFFGLSSAVCYPSKTYAVAKTAGTYVYDGSKFASFKVGQWREGRRIKAELDRREEEARKAEEAKKAAEAKLAEFVPVEESTEDNAPLRNAPLSDDPRDTDEVVIRAEPAPSLTEQAIELPAADEEQEESDHQPEIKTEFSFLQSLDRSIDEVTAKIDASQEENVDMGQSTEEDSDMYSTRSS